MSKIKPIGIGAGKIRALTKNNRPRKNLIYNHGFRQDQLDHTRKILKVRRDNG